MNPTINGLRDLLPALQTLSRTQKLRLIELLAEELARDEEEVSLGATGDTFPVWAPHHAFDAAAVLLRELQKNETAP